MDADLWRRTDELFAAALDLPVEEREGFLTAECGEDGALRAAVERLLAADSQAEQFLAAPAVLDLAAQEALEADAAAGLRLGPYTLLHRLGQGGMGTVYLASRDDGAYDRQVAVKLLRWTFDDGDLRHRFLAERQILARLEHPHIARLYDGGTTPDGQPYLVLEHVEGLPLDVYCDTHRLSVEARIALVRKVCSAVQHAHRNLLVHRDLKP
ncbi:MAG TPA: serine/threonine protein kinase, partial [Acidobacteria bacterium]|nr:serine/threonine protein kinase [Acidobacteriota bacterium]